MSQPGFARVAPRLYMGSRPPPDHRLGLVFFAVVLCADTYQAPPGHFGSATILRCPIDDGVLSAAERQCAHSAGRAVGQFIRAGRRTLVTCEQGRNRSGLVTGIALIDSGMSAAQAIDAIRRARGPNALSNPHFVRELYQFSGERPSLRPAA